MRVLYPVIGGSGVEIYSERLVAGLAHWAARDSCCDSLRRGNTFRGV